MLATARIVNSRSERAGIDGGCLGVVLDEGICSASSELGYTEDRVFNFQGIREAVHESTGSVTTTVFFLFSLSIRLRNIP